MKYNDDSCDCVCHKMPDTHHIMACCTNCPNCQKKIRIGNMKNHQENICSKKEGAMGTEDNKIDWADVAKRAVERQLQYCRCRGHTNQFGDLDSKQSCKINHIAACCWQCEHCHTHIDDRITKERHEKICEVLLVNKPPTPK